MLEAVESAGRLRAATSRTSCYTPKTLKAIAAVEGGAIGDVTWVRSRETHPGPALGVVLGRPADRWRRDHRPRLPLHRDHPQLRRQGEPAGRGHVPHRHARPPDRRRGQRDRADPVRVGRDRPVRGELDVPRRDGPARRGRRHARHDLAEPLPAHRVRDVHAPGAGGGYVAEKAETARGLAVPGRRRGVRARLRRHVQRHVPGDRGGRRRARRSTTAMSSTRSWTPATARRRAAAGSRSSWSGAAASTRADRVDARDVRGPGRHQARDPARRPPQADPQGPGERATSRTGSWPG